MTKTELITKVSGAFNKVGFQLKKHSPEILMVVGIAGTVVSAVMACKATTKLDTVLEEPKKTINEICTAMDGEEDLQEDGKKALAIVYAQTSLDVVKLYAPSVILGTLSIASILASNNILRKRTAALAAAYVTVDKSFKEYRKRVAERYGEEEEYKILNNIKTETIEETVVDENGKQKKIKKTIDVVNDAHNPYAQFFDEACPDWTKNPAFNRDFLRARQNYANDLLVTNKHLFLNDVYKMLGMPEIPAGQVVGWIYDPENENIDSYVDFGLIEISKDKTREFLDGEERTFLCNFNVQGYILDDVDQEW